MNVSNDSDSMVLMATKDKVATIVINRPQRHNSLVSELLTQLKASFSKIRKLGDTRAVVLKAAGESFSTGGDLRAFWENRDDIEVYSSDLVGGLNDAIASIVECELPVIASVDGRVTGGALGLILACDIIVVTERASFTPYYVDVGLSPDGGWTAMLPDIIGRSRASTVQLLNDTISGQQAVEWGIASLMTPADRLDQTLNEICTRILGKKRGSLRTTKRLLKGTSNLDRLNEERSAFVEIITGREAQCGIEEFITNGNDS